MHSFKILSVRQQSEITFTRPCNSVYNLTRRLSSLLWLKVNLVGSFHNFRCKKNMKLLELNFMNTLMWKRTLSSQLFIKQYSFSNTKNHCFWRMRLIFVLHRCHTYVCLHTRAYLTHTYMCVSDTHTCVYLAAVASLSLVISFYLILYNYNRKWGAMEGRHSFQKPIMKLNTVSTLK